jgi:hypothetical protein
MRKMERIRLHPAPRLGIPEGSRHCWQETLKLPAVACSNSNGFSNLIVVNSYSCPRRGKVDLYSSDDLMYVQAGPLRAPLP